MSSIKVFISDAIVIGKGNEEPVRYKVSEKTGKETATFSVGKKMYDASYSDNCRYNNFFVTVPSYLVETVKRMKLTKNSMVHLTLNMDFTKDVLAAREQKGDKNSPDYGKSRLVDGMIMKLVDIEFAGTNTKRVKPEVNPNNSLESQKDVTENTTSSIEDVGLDEEIEMASSKCSDTTAPTVAATNVPTKDKQESLEDKLKIEVINLDERDIFKPRTRRTFF